MKVDDKKNEGTCLVQGPCVSLSLGWHGSPSIFNFLLMGVYHLIPDVLHNREPLKLNKINKFMTLVHGIGAIYMYKLS